MQVIPEPKSVVVLKPRRHARQYEDPWMDMQLGAANKATYFLIRNGENLYSMTTDFNIGERVIGTEQEFTALFLREESKYEDGNFSRVKVPMEPGSASWMKAEEEADAKTRHYMRVGLILQGLIDRTTVFHPLPERGVSMLDHECFSDGRVRLLTNEERLLDAGLEPFYTWQKRLMSQVTPGMRIIGSWGWNSDMELYPQYATRPASLQPHVVDRIDRDRFAFLYHRSDMVDDYDRWGTYRGQKPASKRATAYISVRDGTTLPFDLVTIEQMEAYLAARTERHAYMEMVPLLKAAIAAKTAEHEAEQPFRDALVSALVRVADLDAETAASEADTLITWFKYGIRNHRPLAGDPEHEAKASRMILREAKRRAAADRSGDETTNTSALLAVYPKALAILRKADGTFVIYVPEERAYPDVATRVFVKVYEVTKAALVEPKRWQVVSPAAGRWRVMHESPDWANWNKTARVYEHPTDADIETMVAEGKARLDENFTFYGALLHKAEGHWRDGYHRRMPFVTVVGVLLEQCPTPTLPFSEHTPRMKSMGVEVGMSGKGKEKQIVARERSHRDGRDPLSGYGYPKTIETDAATIKAFEDEVARRAALDAAGEPIRAHARAAGSAWLQAWRDAWLARARARFDEDYTDPELWEGHLKTLREPRDPESSYYLEGICGRVLERGAEINGLTGAEILALHDQLVGNTIADPDWHAAEIPGAGGIGQGAHDICERIDLRIADRLFRIGVFVHLPFHERLRDRQLATFPPSSPPSRRRARGGRFRCPPATRC